MFHQKISYFLKEWEDLPKINIAFYGYDKKWGFKGDVRKDGTLALKQKKKQKKEL